MNTPIYDFVKEYSEKNALRLHMPGHKGKPHLGCESFDITEINGADVLYKAEGIIRESQENATALFKSGKTLYSTEGSSLSIRAMLYLAMLWGEGRSKKILAARNVHKTFMSAAALLDFETEWMYGEENSLLLCKITPDALREKLSSMEEKPLAVYVTSPDYLGNTADIEGLSQVCREFSVLLLCDNAHGAYLGFLKDGKHPIVSGADMCSDSAHKTLPVLTGGGYLHIRKDAPSVLFENAQRAMSLFASTSPSYLILSSLDIANKALCEDYSEKLERTAERLKNLKASLERKGYEQTSSEPMKLTIYAKNYGYEGEALASILEKKGIVCEFADKDFLVMMFTPSVTEEEFTLIEKAFDEIERKSPIFEKAPQVTPLEKVLSPREAMFRKGELLPLSECEGKILCEESVSCPPAVPILVCGERITKNALRLFSYYGIEKLRVICDE